MNVSKLLDSEYQSVLGTIEFSQGRNYWEIRIEKY